MQLQIRGLVRHFRAAAFVAVLFSAGLAETERVSAQIQEFPTETGASESPIESTESEQHSIAAAEETAEPASASAAPPQDTPSNESPPEGAPAADSEYQAADAPAEVEQGKDCCVCQWMRKAECDYVNTLQPDNPAIDPAHGKVQHPENIPPTNSLEYICRNISGPYSHLNDCHWNNGRCRAVFDLDCEAKLRQYEQNPICESYGAIEDGETQLEGTAILTQWLLEHDCTKNSVYDGFGHGRGCRQPLTYGFACLECAANSGSEACTVVANQIGCQPFKDLDVLREIASEISQRMVEMNLSESFVLRVTASQTNEYHDPYECESRFRIPATITITAAGFSLELPACAAVRNSECATQDQTATCSAENADETTLRCCRVSPPGVTPVRLQYLEVDSPEAQCPAAPGECGQGKVKAWSVPVDARVMDPICDQAWWKAETIFNNHQARYEATCAGKGGTMSVYGKVHDPTTTHSCRPSGFSPDSEYHAVHGNFLCCVKEGAEVPLAPPEPESTGNWCRYKLGEGWKDGFDRIARGNSNPNDCPPYGDTRCDRLAAEGESQPPLECHQESAKAAYDRTVDSYRSECAASSGLLNNVSELLPHRCTYTRDENEVRHFGIQKSGQWVCCVRE